MKTGQILILEISDVARGGSGVARADTGQTVFVPHTLTGDRVRARITEFKKRFAHAEMVELLEASPQRQSAPCAVFGQCGGCQWQHIPYELQWQIKLNGVIQVMKSAGINSNATVEAYPAEKIWHYRNRIQLRGYGNQLGYHAPRSHDIVPIDRCEIAQEIINTQLDGVREQGRVLAKPYKVELEALNQETVRAVWNQSHGAAGFRQINDEQNKRLCAWVGTALQRPLPLLDLYGGSGNLSLQLAQNRDVACVDVSAPKQSPDDAPERVTFHQSDVLPWLKQQITGIKFKHLPLPQSKAAIIDPPRGGLGKSFTEISERLEFLKVEELVAVGCKTDSWARDVAGFIQRGWTLHRVAAFDFFPHTVHMETTALLRRE